jgi:uncharacterized membrane protein
MSAWSLGLSVVGVLAYAAVSHGLMTQAAASPWTVAVLLGPPAFALMLFAWRARRWWLLAAVTAVFAATGLAVARGGLGTLSLLYLLQHAGIHVALGTAFAASVRGPSSFVGRLAARVHPLTPAMLAYTRRVTQAWALYFFAMAGLSVVLWHAASWAHWSLFASFGTPLGVITMFVGEHLLRYRLHPDFERASLRDVVHAWRRPHACGTARP